MKGYENKEVAKEIIEMLKNSSTPRSRSNWSVSMLVCCPRRAYWWKKGEVWKPDDPDTLQLLFARGRAHHGILEVYPDKEKTLFKDGVSGHYDMRGERIFEIYTTMLSSAGIEDALVAAGKFKIKLDQLECYLYMDGTTEGDLMIFFLMGDYSRPVKPQLKVFTYSFDPLELKVHWKDKLDRIEYIEERVRIAEPPEEMGESYECINCGYRYCCVEFLQSRYNEVVVELLDAYKRGEVVL